MATHYASSDFTWKKDKLYFNDLMIEVVPHESFPNMFRLRWPDGILSKDFYNYTRARDNALKVSLTKKNGIEEEPWNAQEMDGE